MNKITKNTIDKTNNLKYMYMRQSKSGVIHISFSNWYIKLLIIKIMIY